MEVLWSCSNNIPCPLCKKCRNVSDTMYYECATCNYAKNRCRHSGKDIMLMIRRENFRLTLNEDTKKELVGGCESNAS